MGRVKVCSGLIGLALAAGVAAQQPPAETKPEVPLRGDVVVFKYPEADGVDGAVTAALANHPDVKLAEAKLRVAEAELAQAKLLVAQRVAATAAKVTLAKAKVAAAGPHHDRLLKLSKAGNVSAAEVAGAEQALAAAKAELAAAEAELKAAQGVAPGTPTTVWSDGTVRLWDTSPILVDHSSSLNPVITRLDADIVRQLSRAQPPAGSPMDKLRDQLKKEVTLDQKKMPLDEALAAFQKAAGLTDLTVRYPDWVSAAVTRTPPTVGPLTGKRPVAGWLQLILDDFNRSSREFPLANGEVAGRYDLYVRDYGLLLAKSDLAPPGAMTLAQFAARQTAPTDAGGGGPSHDMRVKVAELLAARVKLPEQKDMSLRELVTAVVKAAGSDLEVTAALYTDGPLTLLGGERTVAAWLAMMLDQRNGTHRPNERVVIFVREYGLLLGQDNNPPPGAVPLSGIGR